MTEYYVFMKQGYDRAYWCVAGNEVSFLDAICFLTYDEAVEYAKTLNESRRNRQGSNRAS